MKNKRLIKLNKSIIETFYLTIKIHIIIHQKNTIKTFGSLLNIK